MKFLMAILFLIYGTLQVFAQSSLPDLKSLDDLQKPFNSEAGKVRLIALLSPT